MLKSQERTSPPPPPPPVNFPRNVVCTGCGSIINDRFLLQVNGLSFHSKCLVCSSCRVLLDNQTLCYFRNSNVYCKTDYHRLFGTKCSKCSRSINPTDWVRRARTMVFHLACFACDACKRQLSTGEEFALEHDKVYCKSHFQELFDLPNTQHSSNEDSCDGTESSSDATSSSRSKSKTKRVRTTFTDEQLQVLQANFQIDSNPDGQDLERIAQITGLSKRVTQVWFQNSRARQKKHLQKQKRKGWPQQQHNSSSDVVHHTVSSAQAHSMHGFEKTSAASQLSEDEEYNPNDQVRYFTSDPALNQFHTHWHIDNPYWWDQLFYRSKRQRRGELFLYMHHQVLSRYNIERVNNGVEEASPLNLTKHGVIREAYYPDVRNINFEPFPYRDNNTELTDAGNTNISYLQTIYTRLHTAVMDNYFIDPNNSHVEINTNLLGDTTESSSFNSANHDYYGSFHNYLHRLIAGIGIQEPGKHIPGVQAHPETSMRDPVFYEIHSLVDSLYLQEKAKLKPYTQSELGYEGVELRSVSMESLNSSGLFWWPPLVPNFSKPTITTYFENITYDVSTSERPCRSSNEPPVYVTKTRLNHVKFKYVMRVKNNLPFEAHAMVRMFLLPTRNFQGSSYTEQESYARAIELDRFQINIVPKTQTILTRLSSDSSVTTGSEIGGRPFRNCGFPANLLIPKGTPHGVEYKLFVMLTNEPVIEEYPNYAYCGSLDKRFPDNRAMGFPFDRPGTLFKQNSPFYPWFSRYAYKNVKFTTIRVVHNA